MLLRFLKCLRNALKFSDFLMKSHFGNLFLDIFFEIFFLLDIINDTNDPI